MKSGTDLSWIVKNSDVAYLANNNEWVVDPTQVAKIRVDTDGTEHLLGYTSKRYETVQNQTIFDMLQPMLAEEVLVVANQGYLQCGKLVYVQCLLNDVYTIGNDAYKNYITITNSHTGTTKLRLGTGMVRIVCENTFNLAQQDLEVSFYHNSGLNESLSPELVYPFVNSEMQRFQDSVARLQSVKVDHKRAHEIITKVYGNGVKDRMRHGIVQLYKTGKGNNGQTAYDLFNGTTDYFSHYSKNTESKSLSNVLTYGDSDTKIVKMLNHLLELS